MQGRGGGSLGWSLDDVYMHQVPLKNYSVILKRKNRVPAGASTSIVFSDVVALDQSFKLEVSSRIIVMSACPSYTSIIVEPTRASLI